MESVRWGIIGCGDVCERKSGPPLYQLEHSRLQAVMRRNAARAADFAARHGVPAWYDSVDDLLADPAVDAVYVATPDAAHEAGTLAAAAAGKHVLVEKAMASDAAACSRMIAACHEAGVSLGVAYYRRCYPSILRARELLDEGAIGTLRELRLNDEFPLSHRLDLVHFFCGSCQEVWCSHGNCMPNDHTGVGPVLHASTASGAEAQTRLDWDEQLTPESLILDGSAGRIEVIDLKAGLLRVTPAVGEVRDEDCGPLPWMHWGLMANFVDHLRLGTPLACNGTEGRKSTVILDIVAALASDDQRVAVDYSN